MKLSPLAAHLAAEINAHDWSDAPYRFDRAGHRREWDSPSRLTLEVLPDHEAELVQTNVAMVVAQVLGYVEGTNFDPHEFALQAGVPRSIRLTSKGLRSGAIDSALRRDEAGYDVPGSTLRREVRDAHSLEDAMAGVLRYPEEDAHNLAPRTTVSLIWNGQVFGHGVLRHMEIRHGYHVAVWERYFNYPTPR